MSENKRSKKQRTPFVTSMAFKAMVPSKDDYVTMFLGFVYE